MKKTVSFSVEIKAIAKARPRKGRHGFYTPKPTADFEKRIKLEAMKYFQEPFSGPIKMHLIFYVKAKNKKLWNEPKTTRPDLDNALKSLLDALNGVAYIDDGQVFSIEAQKIWAPIDKIQVVVEG